MKATLKYFEKFGDYYIHNHLKIFDIKKFIHSNSYAVRLFFYKYAYARAGAPKSFRIAATKSLFNFNRNSNPVDLFNKVFYHGPNNQSINPILDIDLSNINFSHCAKLLKESKFKDAFGYINLKGIGHKIKALFLRDTFYLLSRNSDLNPPLMEEYLLLFPVDIWVRLFAQGLNIEPKMLSSDPSKTFFSLRV